MEQDEEQEAPPTVSVPPTTGRKRNREISQTLRDAQEFVGAPSTSFRQSRPPQRYSGYMALMSDLIDKEPSGFQEASKQQVWHDAMVEEYASIMKNNVWEVGPRPEGKSMVGSRWIYKIKHVADGNIEKFKVKFVAKGFSQKEGVDYDETFSLVARYTSC